jgi:hypothetical protein
MSTTNDANASQITNLYQALLGRAPDEGGLNFWDNTGLSTQAIQAEFLRSPEYRTKSIDDLYGNVLGREPDAGGLDYWNQSNLDPSQIQSEMLKSPEYKTSVQGLYSDVFGRQPDSGGLNYWQNSGLGVPKIKQEMLQSPEYSSGISNLYRSILGRQPDASGQMFWQTSGLGLPDMAQQFMDAPEYIKDSGYQSNLVASLRSNNAGAQSNNPGVKLLQNPQNSTLTLNFNKPVPTGLSNRFEKLTIKPTTPASQESAPPAGGGGDGGGGGGGGFVNDANSDQITRLYLDILRREPDQGGLQYWDQTGLGVDDIANSFRQSEEYRSINDANAEQISGLYREVLGRDPDEGGLSYWDQTGLGVDDIRNAFLNSEEKKGSVTIKPGENLTGDERTINYDQSDNTADDQTNPFDADADQITALYREILGRDPDEGGLRYWDQTGLGVDDIRNSFLNSEEKKGSVTIKPGENLTGDDRTINYEQNTSVDDGTDPDVFDPANNSSGGNQGTDDNLIIDTFDPVDKASGSNTNDNLIVDTFDPLDANADQIAALYREILGRDPDQGGLSYWDQTGLGVDDIASSFRASQEYSDLMGMNSYQDDQDALDALIELSLAADDAASEDPIGIDLGQAANLGGMFEMYDPLQDFTAITFGDPAGAGGGGSGSKALEEAIVEYLMQ